MDSLTLCYTDAKTRIDKISCVNTFPCCWIKNNNKTKGNKGSIGHEIFYAFKGSRLSRAHLGYHTYWMSHDMVSQLCCFLFQNNTWSDGKYTTKAVWPFQVFAWKHYDSQSQRNYCKKCFYIHYEFRLLGADGSRKWQMGVQELAIYRLTWLLLYDVIFRGRGLKNDQDGRSAEI